MPEGLYALAVLACPLGMAAMMWMMMSANRKAAPADAGMVAKQAELAVLQAQIDHLKAAQPDRDASGGAAPRAQ